MRRITRGTSVPLSQLFPMTPGIDRFTVIIYVHNSNGKPASVGWDVGPSRYFSANARPLISGTLTGVSPCLICP